MERDASLRPERPAEREPLFATRCALWSTHGIRAWALLDTFPARAAAARSICDMHAVRCQDAARQGRTQRDTVAHRGTQTIEMAGKLSYLKAFSIVRLPPPPRPHSHSFG